MDKLILTAKYLESMGHNLDNMTFKDAVAFHQELQAHIKNELPDFLSGGLKA
jgi:hypothetical protein